jgi:hypothetical protein
MSQAASHLTEARGASLPELIAQKSYVLQKVIENGGELSPALEAQLDQVDLSVADRVDAYIEFMAQLQAEENYWKDRADFSRRVSKTCEAIRERVKARVRATMDAAHVDELKGVDMRFKLVPGADALDLDEALLPEDYKTAEVVWTPNKDRIKEDLQLDVEIPGARFRPVKALRTYPNTGERKKKGKKDE